MNPASTPELTLLAHYLRRRRDAIMDAWRTAVAADSKLTTGASLSRTQLNDHLPAILEDFECRLGARNDRDLTAAKQDQQADAAAHGVHRWQQGFNLGEVTRELGRLNECVVSELERYAEQSREVSREAMSDARMIWASHFGTVVNASASQFFSLRQLEAATHIGELESALALLKDLESRREQLWRQAAHDLRGNLGVVSTATAGLQSSSAATSPQASAAFLVLLERNVRSLQRLLEDVTDLTRLRSGQEHRLIEPTDVAQVLRELCESFQPMARERGLYLKVEGQPSFRVDCDEVKVRRIAQNLVLNALKYTEAGGVTVSCGPNEASGVDRWYLRVRDTGPGFRVGAGARLMSMLGMATENAKGVESAAESVGQGDAPIRAGRRNPALPANALSAEVPTANAPPALARSLHQQPGEGLGLSIVKGLCELLDATIALDSKVDEGTTFTIDLPRYPLS